MVGQRKKEGGGVRWWLPFVLDFQHRDNTDVPFDNGPSLC